MPLCQQSLDFLFENRLKDSKQWFEAHKKEYEALVKAPLWQLCREVGESLAAKDPLLVTEPARAVCRLRRDTRFSRDKSLYRDHLWVTWQRGQGSGELPGFYFSLHSDGRFGYGCGLYNASAGYMQQLRGLVQAGDAAWERADRALRGQALFRLEGERYKRPHYPTAPPRQQPWLELRGVSANAHETGGALFDPGLAGRVAAALLDLWPVYEFLLKAGELQHRQALQRPWQT